jgi:nucleotide-binding universal stress UspA family protein
MEFAMAHHPPKRVVVAVDFGEASGAAVAFAGRIAARFGSTLVAVHADTFEVPPYFTREQLELIEQEVRTARLKAEAELRAFVAQRTSLPVEVRVSEQPAVDAVLGAARDADLIVMGTHGRRGPKRWWLGSVAERVIREATVPVLVTHASAGAAGSQTARLDAVLVGAHETGPEARSWADVLATAFDGTVREGPTVDQCAGGAGVAATSIVVVPVPARPASRTVHEAVVALARTCTVPVLFVPANEARTR